jgi:hypothetical protein
MSNRAANPVRALAPPMATEASPEEQGRGRERHGPGLLEGRYPSHGIGGRKAKNDWTLTRGSARGPFRSEAA